ncbi:MAG: LOG family protein [Patescibacteria group bacterium]
MQPTTKTIKRVAIFGDSALLPSDSAYQNAFNTAKLLASSGYIIVNGGGSGIMAAATLGAKEAGGRVEIVVINPADKPHNYEGINSQNLSLADAVYTTHGYQARMNKLMEIADAFVIFKGGTGTLSEVGLTWEIAKFDYGHHEPLIFVGPEWREIVATLEKSMNYENIEKNVVSVVDTPEEVLAVLKKI